MSGSGPHHTFFPPGLVGAPVVAVAAHSEVIRECKKSHLSPGQLLRPFGRGVSVDLPIRTSGERTYRYQYLRFTYSTAYIDVAVSMCLLNVGHHPLIFTLQAFQLQPSVSRRFYAISAPPGGS